VGLVFAGIVPGKALRAAFRQDRGRQFCAALNQVPGFRCAVPRSAFYAFANVRGTGMGSRELADFLLEEADVSCLNGAAFGEYGERYIRFSYANSLENLMLAAERIRGVAERGGGGAGSQR
jgi:aspartate aminotransferase